MWAHILPSLHTLGYKMGWSWLQRTDTLGSPKGEDLHPEYTSQPYPGLIGLTPWTDRANTLDLWACMPGTWDLFARHLRPVCQAPGTCLPGTCDLSARHLFARHLRPVCQAPATCLPGTCDLSSRHLRPVCLAPATCMPGTCDLSARHLRPVCLAPVPCILAPVPCIPAPARCIQAPVTCIQAPLSPHIPSGIHCINKWNLSLYLCC